MRRVALATAALTIVLGGCSNLGLDEIDCNPPERDVSSRKILTVQAVPTARYTPCIDDIQLGWDNIEWRARKGEAQIRITNGHKPVPDSHGHRVMRHNRCRRGALGAYGHRPLREHQLSTGTYQHHDGSLWGACHCRSEST